MHDDNEDLPDMYKEFGINQSWLTEFDNFQKIQIKMLQKLLVFNLVFYHLKK